MYCSTLAPTRPLTASVLRCMIRSGEHAGRAVGEGLGEELPGILPTPNRRSDSFGDRRRPRLEARAGSVARPPDDAGLRALFERSTDREDSSPLITLDPKMTAGRIFREMLALVPRAINMTDTRNRGQENRKRIRSRCSSGSNYQQRLLNPLVSWRFPIHHAGRLGLTTKPIDREIQASASNEWRRIQGPRGI